MIEARHRTQGEAGGSLEEVYLSEEVGELGKAVPWRLESLRCTNVTGTIRTNRKQPGIISPGQEQLILAALTKSSHSLFYRVADLLFLLNC